MHLKKILKNLSVSLPKEEKEKLEKGKVKPEDLFRSETDKYSAFDEKGIATLDKEGNPLSKSA